MACQLVVVACDASQVVVLFTPGRKTSKSVELITRTPVSNLAVFEFRRIERYRTDSSALLVNLTKWNKWNKCMERMEPVEHMHGTYGT
jgi:hypothetical protein